MSYSLASAVMRWVPVHPERFTPDVLRMSGWTYAGIARELGLNAKTVERWAKRGEVPDTRAAWFNTHLPGALTEPTPADATALDELAGKLDQAIAEVAESQRLIQRQLLRIEQGLELAGIQLPRDVGRRGAP